MSTAKMEPRRWNGRHKWDTTATPGFGLMDLRFRLGSGGGVRWFGGSFFEKIIQHLQISIKEPPASGPRSRLSARNWSADDFAWRRRSSRFSFPLIKPLTISS
jgi:hypothetical protein